MQSDKWISSRPNLSVILITTVLLCVVNYDHTESETMLYTESGVVVIFNLILTRTKQTSILISRCAHGITCVLVLSDLVNIKMSMPGASVIKHMRKPGGCLTNLQTFLALDMLQNNNILLFVLLPRMRVESIM